MIRFLTILPLILFITIKLNGQSIDILKLSESEVPTGYSLTDKNNCISMQASMFYDKPETYEALIGKVKEKQIQNFDSEKDNGCIMYFEFEEKFKAEDFLKGFIWGGKKSTKEHPEEFYSKGKFLIIWSFYKNNAVTKASKEKIKKAIN